MIENIEKLSHEERLEFTKDEVYLDKMKHAIKYYKATKTITPITAILFGLGILFVLLTFLLKNFLFSIIGIVFVIVGYFLNKRETISKTEILKHL